MLEWTLPNVYGAITVVVGIAVIYLIYRYEARREREKEESRSRIFNAQFDALVRIADAAEKGEIPQEEAREMVKVIIGF